MPADESDKARPLDVLTFPVLALPAKVRDLIWDLAVTWPDFVDWYNWHHRWYGSASLRAEWSPPLPHPGRPITPSILLVNRQITEEARRILYAKPLVLERPPKQDFEEGKVVELTKFMSVETFRRLEFVVLRPLVDSAVPRESLNDWSFIMHMFFGAFRRGHSLESLVVQMDPERYPKGDIDGVDFLERLWKLRNSGSKPSVVFEWVPEGGTKVRLPIEQYRLDSHSQ